MEVWEHSFGLSSRMSYYYLPNILVGSKLGIKRQGLGDLVIEDHVTIEILV